VVVAVLQLEDYLQTHINMRTYVVAGSTLIPNVNFGAADACESFVHDALSVDVAGANVSAVDDAVVVGCGAAIGCSVCGVAAVVVDDVVGAIVVVTRSAGMIVLICDDNITLFLPATSAADVLGSDTVAVSLAAGFTSLTDTSCDGGVVSPVKKLALFHQCTHSHQCAFDTCDSICTEW
jgi:ribose 5-phosphate isomerase RpiB